VLTAIVDGIKPGKPEETRLAAVVALQNSLEFCEENFTREHERNMLMQVSVRAGAGAPFERHRVRGALPSRGLTARRPLACICAHAALLRWCARRRSRARLAYGQLPSSA